MRLMPSPRQKQAGATLIVALILLVVMTLLALSGLSTVTTGERMTANTFDRAIALQTAEAVLRIAEDRAEDEAKNANLHFPGLGGQYADTDSTCGPSVCTDGLCQQPDKDCKERWRDSATSWKSAWSNTAQREALGLPEFAPLTGYIVEYLGTDYPCDPEDPVTVGKQVCKRYRITVRAGGGSERAQVMLQTIYATKDEP